MSRSAPELAALVDDRMREVFTLLDAWRGDVEEALRSDPKPAVAGDVVVPSPADAEIKRLRDELAKANAELERIRRRLSQPPPRSR